MPSSNPTTGVGVIAYVQATATPVALTNTSGGSGSAQGTNGQGIGAVPSTNHPVAQYAVTLSLANSPTTTVTAVLKDVANTTVTSSNGNVAVFKSYNNFSQTETTFSSLAPAISYSAKVASVNASTGLITALAKGQAIIEVQFATFDNTEGVFTQTGNPKDFVAVQIVVTVTA